MSDVATLTALALAKEALLEARKKADQGPAGMDGITGADGKDGLDGSNGIDGSNGQDGKDGNDGIQGPQGIPGTKGGTGPSGRDGKDGREGTSGEDGKTPEHKWSGENLSIQNPDGTWGKEVNLKGSSGSGGGGFNVSGGTTNQVLAKKSDKNYDMVWKSVSGGGGVDWEVTGPEVIHADRYTDTDTIYTISKADVESVLTGEIATHTHAGGGGTDWELASQGTIHASNYVDTDTTYNILDTATSTVITMSDTVFEVDINGTERFQFSGDGDLDIYGDTTGSSSIFLRDATNGETYYSTFSRDNSGNYVDIKLVANSIDRAHYRMDDSGRHRFLSNAVEYVRVDSNGVSTDNIIERTSAAGVTVDGVLLKDGLVDGIDIATDVSANTAARHTHTVADIDWSASQASNIHADNYTDTDTREVRNTFDLSDPTVTDDINSGHVVGDSWLSPGGYFICAGNDVGAAFWVGMTANGDLQAHIALTDEHIDWTIDQGATNLHAGNYTDTVYTHPNHSGDVVSSGDGAMTIQVDAVDIPMLSATGTADATTFLRGDNTWAIPAGPQGDKGDTGDTGAAGTNGTNGADGSGVVVFFGELTASVAATAAMSNTLFDSSIKTASATHTDGVAGIDLAAGTYEVHASTLGQNVGNNRVESYIDIDIDATTQYAYQANYSQRNTTQDLGGVSTFYVLTVTEGQTLNIRNGYQGTTNTIIDARVLIRKV